MINVIITDKRIIVENNKETGVEINSVLHKKAYITASKFFRYADCELKPNQAYKIFVKGTEKTEVRVLKFLKKSVGRANKRSNIIVSQFLNPGASVKFPVNEYVGSFKTDGNMDFKR